MMFLSGVQKEAFVASFFVRISPQTYVGSCSVPPQASPLALSASPIWRTKKELSGSFFCTLQEFKSRADSRRSSQILLSGTSEREICVNLRKSARDVFVKLCADLSDKRRIWRHVTMMR